MSIAELKLQVISKIMESDDAGLAAKMEKLLGEANGNAEENSAAHAVHPDNNTIIAYRADGQPLTIKDLKAEILEITDDGCRGSKPATHCSVKTRLKGILWL